MRIPFKEEKTVEETGGAVCPYCDCPVFPDERNQALSDHHGRWFHTICARTLLSRFRPEQGTREPAEGEERCPVCGSAKAIAAACVHCEVDEDMLRMRRERRAF